MTTVAAVVAPLAAAGILHAPPGEGVFISSAAHCCGGVDSVSYGPGSTGWECGGGKAVFVPTCTEITPISATCDLSSGPCEVRRVCGVEQVIDPLGMIAEVDPSRHTPMLATRNTVSAQTHGMTIEFEATRPAPEQLVQPEPCVLRAWPSGSLAGFAMLSEDDDQTASFEFELDTTAIVRLDALIGAVDVRTNDYVWQSTLTWVLTDSSDTQLASCRIGVSVPDQETSLDEPRPSRVDVSDSLRSTWRLQAGRYKLTGAFSRYRFDRLAPQTHASLNGCGTMFGAWSVLDVASLSLSLALPTDLDGSGEVDFGDAAFALLEYGACPGCASDLDGSGDVNFGDVALVLLDFGTVAPTPDSCSCPPCP